MNAVRRSLRREPVPGHPDGINSASTSLKNGDVAIPFEGSSHAPEFTPQFDRIGGYRRQRWSARVKVGRQGKTPLRREAHSLPVSQIHRPRRPRGHGVIAQTCPTARASASPNW